MPSCDICRHNKRSFIVLHEPVWPDAETRRAPAHFLCEDCFGQLRQPRCPFCQANIGANGVRLTEEEHKCAHLFCDRREEGGYTAADFKFCGSPLPQDASHCHHHNHDTPRRHGDQAFAHAFDEHIPQAEVEAESGFEIADIEADILAINDTDESVKFPPQLRRAVVKRLLRRNPRATAAQLRDMVEQARIRFVSAENFSRNLDDMV